ncbi:MAG TPA: hypothetical protein VG079_03560 [Gaiellaceae bacterium]|nr:hypothetical protein [Gaiellaceae bacterium]
MGRRRLAWRLTVPLAAAGALSAHVLAYALVSSDHHSHSSVHAALMQWRVCVALCLALAVVAAVGYAFDALGGRDGREVPVWAFALLPPAGFVIQEQLEHVLAHGALSPTLALEPVFILGLLLQVPFAAAAYLVARALVTVAVTLIRALGRPRLRLAPTSGVARKRSGVAARRGRS